MSQQKPPRYLIYRFDLQNGKLKLIAEVKTKAEVAKFKKEQGDILKYRGRGIAWPS